MKRRTSKSTIKDWKTIFDSAKDPMMLIDLNFVIKEANRSTFYFLDKSVKEIIGKQCFRLIHGSNKPPEDCPVLMLKQTEKHEEAEIYLPDRDIWIWVTAIPIFNDNGRITHIAHVVRDITGHKLAERELEEMKEKYRSLVQSIDDSIYLVDRNYKYLFINKKHMQRMGISEDADYLGQDYGKFHSPGQTGWFIKKADIVFDTGKSIRHEYKSDSNDRYFHFTLSPVKESNGKIQAITVVSRDITDYKKMEGRLRTMSLSDELTGLHNRRGFFALVDQLLKISRRERKGLYLLYADVDNLKAINDKYGHREGDMVLIEIANILKKNFRESDIIARIGGDEFVVFPVCNKGDNIEVITTRLKNCIEMHNAKVNRGYNISISFGVSYYDPLKPCPVHELLDRGD